VKCCDGFRQETKESKRSVVKKVVGNVSDEDVCIRGRLGGRQTRRPTNTIKTRRSTSFRRDFWSETR